MCACTQSWLTLLTPWTVAHQALLSMEFSRQEYWSELLFLPAGNLPDPGTKPMSHASPALAGGFFTTRATWEGQINMYRITNHRNVQAGLMAFFEVVGSEESRELSHWSSFSNQSECPVSNPFLLRAPRTSRAVSVPCAEP